MHVREFLKNFSLKFHKGQDQIAHIKHSLKITEGMNAKGLQVDFPVNHFLRTIFLLDFRAWGDTATLASGPH